MKNFLFGLILGGLLVFGHFFAKENPDNIYITKGKEIIGKITKKQATIGLANPASTYCIEQNGQLTIQDGENGQIGVCTFSDGSCCEERAFFRGECQQSSQYCDNNGNTITQNEPEDNNKINNETEEPNDQENITDTEASNEETNNITEPNEEDNGAPNIEDTKENNKKTANETEKDSN